MILLSFSVSLFGSDIRDFIMLERVGEKMSRARNIKAIRLGGEIEGKWKFARHWEIGSSLAYTYGQKIARTTVHSLKHHH